MSTADFASIIQAVRRNQQGRFLGADGVLYDYAGLCGETVLPTADDCASNRPNALGWWTPIENGGFFNGDYVLGLLAGYETAPHEETRKLIRCLVKGLYLLQDVCDAEGCIARGVGEDGRCHYPASSNDQVFPWLLALWRYGESDIPDATEKSNCRSRMLRVLRALTANNWRIPGDRPGFERGSFLAEENALECRLSSVHISTASWLLDDLEGRPDFPTHRKYLRAQLLDGRTREEWLYEGFPELQPWQCWFTSHSVYALRELARRTDDAHLRAGCEAALITTAQRAADHIGLYRKYVPGSLFTPDWHVMNDAWIPQADCDAAQRCAMEELKIWDSACPAIAQEKECVMGSLAASWIVAIGGDADLRSRAIPEAVNAVRSFDYATLHYAAFFYAENTINEIAKMNFNPS